MPVKHKWIKSSYSDPENLCVEVCFSENQVLIRDSKHHGASTERPQFCLSDPDWREFLLAVVTEGSMPATSKAELSIQASADGIELSSSTSRTVLQFTKGEWNAFRLGVIAGEFTI